MSNATVDVSQDVKINWRRRSQLENNIWLTGIIISSLCLILQVVLYIIKPKTRKIDQKILTQLTVARLMNTILEFILDNALFNARTIDLTFELYMQTDVVLTCWMLVYIKNLYEKVVLVFALQKWNFTILSLLIWTVFSIPIGVLCPVFLCLGRKHFLKFYFAYAWLKFIVLTINVLYFCRISYVIVNRNKNRNFVGIIKSCAVSIILVCITSLQAFVDGIYACLDTDKADFFCILNSYQVILVTIIFLILTKNSDD